MTRLLTPICAVALILMLPTTVFAVPAGGAVRTAPVFVRPAMPERSGAARESVRVPFNVSVPPALKSPPSWRGWALRPASLWNSNLCPAGFAPWSRQDPQTFSSDELQSPGFTIGSLAGNPSHSILGRTPSDVAAVTSSNDAVNAGDSASAFAFQYGLQPGLCDRPAFTLF